MSVSQATSSAFQFSCGWCDTVRKAIVSTFLSVYKGIVISRQLQANYQVAERLAGRGDFKGMTIGEVANFINQKTL
jgi:hypothetical protein